MGGWREEEQTGVMERPAHWRTHETDHPQQPGLLSSEGKVPAPGSPGGTSVPGLGNEGRRHGLSSCCNEITLKVAESKRLCREGQIRKREGKTGKKGVRKARGR